MSLKRFSMLSAMVFVASFGVLASCGDKEKSPADAVEEAGDAAEDAADAAEDAADK